MDNLRETYDQARRLLDGAESYAVAEAVEEVRQFWRPKHINTVLLAESHVFTSDDELSVRLRTEKLPVASVPKAFVRFVYCLGYGERQLLERPVASNPGTPQFWRIFDNCCNDPQGDTSRRLLVSRTRFEHRIAAKLALLEQMRATGVWLVDASITALYNRRGNRPDSAMVTNVLEMCWEGYVRNVVLGAAPRRVVVIGKGVGRILGYRLQRLACPFTVLPQPQARLSAAEIAATSQRYFSLCAQCGV